VTGVVVHVRHVRAAGLCGPGLLQWYRGRDRAQLRRFCREGLPVEEVEAIGDHFAHQVAAQARREQSETVKPRG
jgi:hypothetical protein